MNSLRILLAAPSLVAVISCADADADADGSATVTTAKKRPRPVRLATVAPYRTPVGAVFPARVRAERRPALSFRVPGRIATLRVDIGDQVQTGDLLAVLDDADFRTRVVDAKAAVAQARARVAQANRAAGRAGRLFAAKAVSQEERDRTRDLADLASAQLESAQQRLALAERELGYTRLQAPEPGVVVERRADAGANVMAGQSIVLLSGAAVEIRADVPESALSYARPGGVAEIRLPSFGPTFQTAEVVRVAKGATDRSVLYPVFLRLTSSNEALVPGMAAEVRFVADDDRSTNLMAVPPTAVVADPDEPFVWVLNPTDGDETAILEAQRRTIMLERLTSRAAVVSKGLEIGEKVATAGVNYLSEGQRVREARLPPLVFEGVYVPSPLGGGSVEDGASSR